MKKIVCFLLAISLMLSLSFFSFADTVEDSVFWIDVEDLGYNFPSMYALQSFDTGIYYPGASNSYGIYDPALAVTLQSGSYGEGSSWYPIAYYDISDVRNLSMANVNSSYANRPKYWWVDWIFKVTDANGKVLQASDFSAVNAWGYTTTNLQRPEAGGATGVSVGGNLYQFDDGFLQLACAFNGNQTYSFSGMSVSLHIANSVSYTAPFTFQLERFDWYAGETSASVPPFTFGDGAHQIYPDVPVEKNPDDHSQYGSASDQVEWYNDAYGSAVDPELQDKMSATTDMLLQEQEIEEQMIDGINQYAPSVDPANLSMPTQILNGLSFIGTTFMGSYNALGDIGFVISFSMMLGVVLVLIGRGEGALARGMASSVRERRRTEYASDRDMKKGG